MKSDSDILRRLRIVEGVLGIEPETMQACSGDPFNCAVESCDSGACPLRNNPLRRLLDEFGKVAQSLALIRHFLDEYQRSGLLPTWIVEAASLRTQLEELQKRIRATKEILKTLSEGSLKSGLMDHLVAQEQEAWKIEREIEGLRC